MDPAHGQTDYLVATEWGPTGAAALATDAAQRGREVIAVVIDVLSFTTCVSVALDGGIAVRPYRWGRDGAEEFAAAHDAVLARSRQDARGGDGGPSLSPASIRDAAGSITDLVLPSPNGSTITALLAETGATVVAASLRTRMAVARWVVDQLDAGARRGGRPFIVIVPAGERWEDDSLRPAVEDLWGAGAVIAALVQILDHRAGPTALSPESTVALAAYESVSADLGAALLACASGRELVTKGFASDVTIAAELDASSEIPVLRDGAYRPA